MDLSEWSCRRGRSELSSVLLTAILIPHLKDLRNRPNAKSRQKVISEIMSGVDRTRIDTERNMLDILDKVNEISAESVDPTHVFTLSQVYEGLLLKMGEKGNDGGQFFTPREIIRAMVKVIDPEIGGDCLRSRVRYGRSSLPSPSSTWLAKKILTSRHRISLRP